LRIEPNVETGEIGPFAAGEYGPRNLPRERLNIAVSAVAAAEAAFKQTLAYAKDRQAFGQPIGSFQRNRFTLAEIATQLEIARVFIDRCVQLLPWPSSLAKEVAAASAMSP
jgi:alkylation response protein AidB-like acyl-CoA dehydrogenase